MIYIFNDNKLIPFLLQKSLNR